MFDLICNMHSFDHKTALIIIRPEKFVVVGGGGAEANLLIGLFIPLYLVNFTVSWCTLFGEL